MQYPGIKLDEGGRTIECPNCHNTDLYESGKFCIVCGKMIVNICSESIPEGQFSATCDYDTPLPGNARHCPYCGAKTTFFINKYISSWNEEDSEEDSGYLPF